MFRKLKFVVEMQKERLTGVMINVKTLCSIGINDWFGFRGLSGKLMNFETGRTNIYVVLAKAITTGE